MSRKIYREKTVSIGMRFKMKGRTTILAQTAFGKVSLISLDGGNRWNEAVEVRNVMAITKAEFSLCLSADCGSFEQIWKTGRQPK